MPQLFPLVPITRYWHEWTPVPSLGVEVHARVWNDAPGPRMTRPLVLVAGLGCSSRYWVRLGRRLASQFHVLAPDLPGYGRTPRSPNVRWPAGPDVREQAAQLLAWMDAREIGQAVLCGHSTGSQVVAELALRHPERVERIVLAAPTFAIGHRSILDYLPRLIAGSLFEAPSLTPLLTLEYNSAGLPRVLQQAHRFIGDPAEARLPRLKMPTLVLTGQYDPMVPRPWAATVTNGLPRAVGVTIANVGHAVQYSAATVTARVIRDFVDGTLDVDRPPSDDTIVAPVDDPRHDPHGPPQPISPSVHALLDYAVAAAALVVPRLLRWGPRPRRLLTATAVASTAVNLLSDHSLAAARKVPMITHANADIGSGLNLLIAATTYLRREPRAVRWTTLALGVYQIASAALTAKPTGPARVRRG
ncbi:MAG TPA: alpha/beta fold hydrolase [Tepidisphaeraceae bacterium]|jgi:pimeloyl-ACP methyl ester carboxylesterase